MLVLALGMGAVTRPTLGGLLLLWTLIGVGTSAIQTPSGRLLRSSCHPSDRPAFFAAEFALSHAAWLVAYPVAGLVGVTFGMAGALVTLAFITAGATQAALWVWPKHDPMARAHTHRRLSHAHPHVHDVNEHEGWEVRSPTCIRTITSRCPTVTSS